MRLNEGGVNKKSGKKGTLVPLLRLPIYRPLRLHFLVAVANPSFLLQSQSPIQHFCFLFLVGVALEMPESPRTYIFLKESCCHICSRAGRRSERLPLLPPVFLSAEIGVGPLEGCSASAHRLVPSYAKERSALSPRGKSTFGRSYEPFRPR